MSRRPASKTTKHVVNDMSIDSDLNGDTTVKSEAPQNASENSSKERTKKRGRAKAAAETKGTDPSTSKSKAQRTNNLEDAKKTTKRTTKKKVPNIQQTSDGDADELDDLDPGARVKQGAPSAPMDPTREQSIDASAPATTPLQDGSGEHALKPKTRKGRPPTKSLDKIPETQMEDTDVQQSSSNFGKAQKTTRAPRPAKREVVQETQIDDMDVDGDVLIGPEEPPRAKKGGKRQEPKSKTQVLEVDGGHTVPDQQQKASDSTSRQKLSDMTKKFEALELKYNNLKDVGVDEAQANFDELKKRTDERAKASDNLISNLKTELTTQSAKAAESEDLRSQVRDLTAVSEELRNTNKSTEVALASAQAELRMLQAKLQAVRSRSESAIPQQLDAQKRSMPGSATKVGNKLGSRQQVDDNAQKRAMKEELYGDLTGLIIRDVKRRDEDSMDVYDCIQTGKNGTLHFHLALPNPVPQGTAYGDAEFEYTPLLDASHDRNLIDVLPDYLTDEIVFPQREAQRFYSRINEFIMKSRPVPIPEEEDAGGGVDEEEDGACDV